jgi:hypothetical protein
VLLVFATRNTLEQDELSGLPELTVEGLPPAGARRLLAATIPRLLEQGLARPPANAAPRPGAT